MGVMPSFNPSLQNQITTPTTSASKKLGRSFVFNMQTRKFEFENGRNKETTQLEALEQWIALLLVTHKFKFKVYEDTDFYSNIDDLIGQHPSGLIFAELQREITTALLTNELIEKIENFTATAIKRVLNISFTVILKDKSILNINQNL